MSSGRWAGKWKTLPRPRLLPLSPPTATTASLGGREDTREELRSLVASLELQVASLIAQFAAQRAAAEEASRALQVGWRQGICHQQAQLREILHLELGALATSTQLATSLQLQQPPQPNRKVVVFSAAAAEAATQVVAAEIAAGGASPLASKGRRVGIKFLVQVGGSWIPRWYMGVVIHKQGEDMHVQLDGADGDTAWVREDEEDWAYEGLADMRDK